MKLLYVPMLIILFSSCTRVEDKMLFSCDCQQQKEAAKFVKESIKDANNMSDEEMEDVISQLERTSVRLHCSKKTYKVRVGDGVFEPQGVPSGVVVYNY